jgi:hypothetical protein
LLNGLMPNHIGYLRWGNGSSITDSGSPPGCTF